MQIIQCRSNSADSRSLLHLHSAIYWSIVSFGHPQDASQPRMIYTARFSSHCDNLIKFRRTYSKLAELWQGATVAPLLFRSTREFCEAGAIGYRHYTQSLKRCFDGQLTSLSGGPSNAYYKTQSRQVNSNGDGALSKLETHFNNYIYIAIN